MTNTLFAFLDLLHCCAPRPRTPEKNSCVCPVLAGRRTEKWQLWMDARIPWEMEPREEQSSAPLQVCNGQESQREPGHKWCLGGVRAAGKNGVTGAQRSPDRGCSQCYRRTRSNPQATLGTHPGSLESFLPTAAGYDRPSSWGMSSRQQPSQKGLKEP